MAFAFFSRDLFGLYSKLIKIRTTHVLVKVLVELVLDPLVFILLRFFLLAF